MTSLNKSVLTKLSTCKSKIFTLTIFQINRGHKKPFNYRNLNLRLNLTELIALQVFAIYINNFGIKIFIDYEFN